MYHKRQPGILTISPSGNFYGSEQVLMDYLETTKLTSDVVAPSGSMFLDVLQSAGLKQRIRPFNAAGLPLFYASVFLHLLFGKYKVVYLNEAGHSRYVLLLARIFRNKNFLIHVRIKEDTDATRWNSLPGNVRVITISQYMQKLLPVKSTLLYDAYKFSTPETVSPVKTPGNPLRVGVIGRLSSTKGVFELMELLETVQSTGSAHYHFFLFGEEGSDIKGTDTLQKLLSHPAVTMMGFVKDKQEIYNRIDVVLHLSKTEPLGRIFFEAIEETKPLVGIDAAGIGEIGHMTGLSELLIDPGVRDNGISLYEKLEEVRNHYEEFAGKVSVKKKLAAETFNIDHYTGVLDKFLAS